MSDKVTKAMENLIEKLKSDRCPMCGHNRSVSKQPKINNVSLLIDILPELASLNEACINVFEEA